MTDPIRIISPADGSLYFETHYTSDDEAGAVLTAAADAAVMWREMTVADRIVVIDRFVDALVSEADELARMTAWQIGRPLSKSDETCDLRYLYDFYKSTIDKGPGDIVLPGGDGVRRFARHEPYGVNLSICAWNYPVVMMSSLILAPLLTGNVVIFKHAPQVARISTVVNSAARKADLPAGVLQAKDLTHQQCSRLLASGSVGLVNFVGSSRGGHEVRRASAGQFVHEIFELGGKDAAYVRADADIDTAAAELARASFTNSGQSCCSVERIYVDRAVYKRFLEAFREAARGWQVGHPVLDDVALGSVINAEAARRIDREVAAALHAGAKDVLDCKLPDLADPTAYVTPKILTDVDHAMAIMRSETFGPVAPIMPVASDDEAVTLMNDTEYGLTSSVWTSDIERGLALGQRISVGNFYVNQADYVDEYLPWGGIKASGLGRADGFSWRESLTRTKGFYAKV